VTTTLRLHTLSAGRRCATDQPCPHDAPAAVALAVDVMLADVGIHAVDVLDDARVVIAEVDRCVACGAIVTTWASDETAPEEPDGVLCGGCDVLAQRVATMPALDDGLGRVLRAGAAFGAREGQR
jgi:hypothetical protein